MSDLCYLCLAGPSSHNVKGYGFDVCTKCWQAAAQGWDVGFEPAIFNALGRAGLLIPDRNPQGRLPREYAPPADHQL